MGELSESNLKDLLTGASKMADSKPLEEITIEDINDKLRSEYHLMLRVDDFVHFSQDQTIKRVMKKYLLTGDMKNVVLTAVFEVSKSPYVDVMATLYDVFLDRCGASNAYSFILYLISGMQEFPVYESLLDDSELYVTLNTDNFNIEKGGTHKLELVMGYFSTISLKEKAALAMKNNAKNNKTGYQFYIIALRGKVTGRNLCELAVQGVHKKVFLESVEFTVDEIYDMGEGVVRVNATVNSSKTFSGSILSKFKTIQFGKSQSAINKVSLLKESPLTMLCRKDFFPLQNEIHEVIPGNLLENCKAKLRDLDNNGVLKKYKLTQAEALSLLAYVGSYKSVGILTDDESTYSRVDDAMTKRESGSLKSLRMLILYMLSGMRKLIQLKVPTLYYGPVASGELNIEGYKEGFTRVWPSFMIVTTKEEETRWYGSYLFKITGNFICYDISEFTDCNNSDNMHAYIHDTHTYIHIHTERVGEGASPQLFTYFVICVCT